MPSVTSVPRPPSAGCPAPKCSAHTACFQVKLLAAVGSMELLHCAVLLALIFQGIIL